MSHSHDNQGHHTKAEFEAELTHHDDWFRHDPSEKHQSSHGETNPWAIGGVLIALIVITFGVAFYVLNYFNRTVAAEKLVKQEQRTDISLALPLQQARADWNAQLKAYRVIDSKAGTVAIPFDAAAEKVIAQYQSKAGSK